MSESHPGSADFDRLGDLLGEAGLRPASPKPGSTHPPPAPPPMPSAAAPGCDETPTSVVSNGPAPDVDEPGPPRPTRRRAPSSGRSPGRPGRAPSFPGRQEPGAVSPADTARRVAEVWDEAVGPEIAANARPVQLRQGRLVVSTSSSAWAQSLQFMGEAVRVRLNESLQTDEIRTLFFRHAGWEAAPDRGPAASRARAPRAGTTEGAATVGAPPESAASLIDGPPGEAPLEEAPRADAPLAEGSSLDADRQGLSEDQRAALDAVRGLELSPELRQIIGRAMKAAFVREERQ